MNPENSNFAKTSHFAWLTKSWSRVLTCPPFQFPNGFSGAPGAHWHLRDTNGSAHTQSRSIWNGGCNAMSNKQPKTRNRFRPSWGQLTRGLHNLARPECRIAPDTSSTGHVCADCPPSRLYTRPGPNPENTIHLTGVDPERWECGFRADADGTGPGKMTASPTGGENTGRQLEKSPRKA